MDDEVILVDEADNPIGTQNKIQAHIEANLHRAFSIFIFNPEGDLLLQRRAFSKYHAGGMWSNTCCSHPRPNENTAAAAHRRLMEEMGFDCEMNEAFTFTYRAELGKGMIEHEIDHVFIGISDNSPIINKAEVADFKWIKPQELLEDIALEPSKYTPWLKISLKRALNYRDEFIK